MSERYKASYDGNLIFELEITDAVKAKPVLEALVDFWSGGEDRLDEAGGNYTEAFINQVLEFEFCNHRLPGDGDEGYCKLDGTHGIKITRRGSIEFDSFHVSIDKH